MQTSRPMTFLYDMALKKARPIGLAALVDIVFLLLIFFMVASVFTEERMLHVETAEKTGTAEGDIAIVFVLDAQGAMSYRGKPQTLQQIGKIVRSQLSHNANTPFHVEVAEKTHVQDTMILMDTLERLGTQNIRMTLSQAPKPSPQDAP